MKKRVLSILLCILIVAMSIPILPASAEVLSVKSLTMKKMPTVTKYMEQGNGYPFTEYDEITGEPTSRYFYYWTDFSGLEITVVFSNNTSKVYSYDTHYDEFEGHEVTFEDGQENSPWGIGPHTITATIGGKSINFSVSVIASDVEKIEVTKNPLKTEYVLGVDGMDYGDGNFYYFLDLTGIELKVTYKNGTSSVMAMDEFYKLGNYDLNYEDDQFSNPWEVGQHTVTLSYCGKTTTFTVAVVEGNVQKIEVIKNPTKTDYLEGADGFDIEGNFYYFVNPIGMELKVTFNDGTSKQYTIDQYYGIKLDGYDLTIEDDQFETPWGRGAHTVTVGYLGKTTTFTVNVVESNIQSVTITKMPNKTEYLKVIDGIELGDILLNLDGTYYYEIDLTGMEVTVAYTNGTSSVFTVGEDFDGMLNGSILFCQDDQYEKPWDIGEHTVTICYLGKTVDITVSLVEPAYYPGNINGDGAVDLKDVTALSRHIAGWTGITVVEAALDVNGDDLVNLKDVTVLSRYVAGWDVTIY